MFGQADDVGVAQVYVDIASYFENAAGGGEESSLEILVAYAKALVVAKEGKKKV